MKAGKHILGEPGGKHISSPALQMCIFRLFRLNHYFTVFFPYTSRNCGLPQRTGYNSYVLKYRRRSL